MKGSVRHEYCGRSIHVSQTMCTQQPELSTIDAQLGSTCHNEPVLTLWPGDVVRTVSYSEYGPWVVRRRKALMQRQERWKLNRGTDSLHLGRARCNQPSPAQLDPGNLCSTVLYT